MGKETARWVLNLIEDDLRHGTERFYIYLSI